MLAFVIAAGVALALTPGVIFLAAKTGAMDAPDARKVHKKPIPRIGGLGIYAAFMVAILGIMQYGGDFRDYAVHRSGAGSAL